MPTKRDQRKERRNIIVRDQHGRRWESQYDKVGGDLTGQIYPKGWTAPLIPHQKYIKTDTESPGIIRIDYDEWLADIRERRRDWENDGRRYAENMSMTLLKGDAWKEAPEVLRLCGSPPMDEIYVLACKKNSRWALGRSEEVPPELKAFAATLIPSKLKDIEFSDADKFSDGEEEDPEYRELSDEEIAEKAEKMRLASEARERKAKEAKRVAEHQAKMRRTGARA